LVSEVIPTWNLPPVVAMRVAGVDHSFVHAEAFFDSQSLLESPEVAIFGTLLRADTSRFDARKLFSKGG
jgi:hypothetical protein